MTEKTTASDLPFELASEAVAAAFDLQPALISMMLEEPFYSRVLRVVTKIRSQEVPTAGVIAREGDLKMYWNDRFMAGLSPKHVKGVLKHEMLHLIFEHTTTRKYEPHIIWNYATDLAINTHLMNELPEFGLFPGRPFKALTEEQKTKMGPEAVTRYEVVSKKIASMPAGQAAEWYFARLMEDDEVKQAIEKSQEAGSGALGTLDDHEMWESMSEEERELVKAKIKQAAGEAAKACDKKGSWGTVPAELRKMIKECLVNEVPWQMILKRFCGYSKRSDRTTSYSKIHSTLGRLVPGAKRNYTSSIATYIDQSGSVNDAELELCFGELKNLAKSTEFVCYHFDTEVDQDSATEWRRGRTPVAHRTRTGGTCFKAPTLHAAKNKNKFDALIILTDGWAPDPGPSVLSRAWVITPGGQAQDWMKKYKNDVIVKMKWPEGKSI